MSKRKGSIVMPCGSIVYNIDSFATSSGRSNPEKLICQLDDGLEGNEVIIKQKKISRAECYDNVKFSSMGEVRTLFQAITLELQNS